MLLQKEIKEKINQGPVLDAGPLFQFTMMALCVIYVVLIKRMLLKY